MALTGLAAEVSRDQVQGLLLARAEGITDVQTQESTLFEESARGIATEVVPLVGSEVVAGPRRDLAVWAITLGTAAQIEAALFPEQQGPGDQGRAAYLERRYRDALNQLRSLSDTGRQTGAFSVRPGFEPDLLDPYDPLAGS